MSQLVRQEYQRVNSLDSTTHPFMGLGPSVFPQSVRGELSRFPIPNRLEARNLLHDHCPLTPGVYAWLDGRQQICYVGKSKSLRKRLLSYFAQQTADPKATRIREHSVSLVWEPLTNELLALLREQELINRWRPEFNTQGQPVKRQPAFLCFRKGAVANAFFTRRLSVQADIAFGPIAGTKKLRSAVESLNQTFRLRDCPDKTRFEFNDQQQLFGNPITPACIRFELGSCPAPCAAKCSHSEYLAGVTAAKAFVNGKSAGHLRQLEEEMKAASRNQKFEKAVVLRDHHRNLKWLDRRMKELRSAKRNLNGVLPIPSWASQPAWLILRHGRLVGSLDVPHDSPSALSAIKLLTQIASERDRFPESILEMNLQLIIGFWFRKFPKRKRDLISFSQAVQICESTLDSKSSLSPKRLTK